MKIIRVLQIAGTESECKSFESDCKSATESESTGGCSNQPAGNLNKWL